MVAKHIEQPVLGGVRLAGHTHRPAGIVFLHHAPGLLVNSAHEDGSVRDSGSTLNRFHAVALANFVRTPSYTKLALAEPLTVTS
jgi:hypothetical protein